MKISPEPLIRKSVNMPEELWQEIDNFRFENRISTETEAIRRLLTIALHRSQTEKKK